MKIIFLKNRNKKIYGQILIESIVAIMVAIMGLLGILTLLTKSLAINREMSEKFIATYLAAEGIEIVKNLVDVNYTSAGYCSNPLPVVGGRPWNAGLEDGSYEFDYSSTFNIKNKATSNWLKPYRINPPNATSTMPLVFNGSDSIYRYPDGLGAFTMTPFIRTVRIRNIQNSDGYDYQLVVTSIVEWTTKGKKQEVKLEDHFFDWRGTANCPVP